MLSKNEILNAIKGKRVHIATSEAGVYIGVIGTGATPRDYYIITNIGEDMIEAVFYKDKGYSAIPSKYEEKGKSYFAIDSIYHIQYSES
jgi:hypothetical protein